MKVPAILLCLFLTASASAKIWRVNNNNGIAADFTTVQAAHEGAAAGDTIYVEGSSASYGSLSCTKRLYIVGPGYYMDQVPNTNADNYTALVSSFTLYPGSEGSVIQGLDFNGSSISVYANNIMIRRNKFSQSSGNEPIMYHGAINLYYPNNNSNIGVSNIIITQNYGISINIQYASTGILITNNVIGFGAAYGENTTNDCLNANQNARLLIQNNIFRRGSIDIYGSNLANNIMVNGFFNVRTNQLSNNIANGTQFGNANNNKENITMTNVFAYTGSWDEWYKLKANSPAKGAGYGNTDSNPVDCGIYSGATPYVVAGQSNMPVIYYFSNQPIGSNTDPIKVDVKVKAAGNRP